MEREQTKIRLPTELKEKLQEQADKMGESFNGLLLIICDEFLSSRQNNQN